MYHSPVKEFGEDYTTFGVLTNGAFIQGNSPEHPFMIDWATTNYFVEMDREYITLHLPNIIFSGLRAIKGQVVSLKRVPGASFTMNISQDDPTQQSNLIFWDNTFKGVRTFEPGKPGDQSMVVKLAFSQPDGVVMVLGFKPYK
jgi:hypothetical protein